MCRAKEEHVASKFWKVRCKGDWARGNSLITRSKKQELKQDDNRSTSE